MNKEDLLKLSDSAVGDIITVNLEGVDTTVEVVDFDNILEKEGDVEEGFPCKRCIFDSFCERNNAPVHCMSYERKSDVSVFFTEPQRGISISEA